MNYELHKVRSTLISLACAAIVFSSAYSVDLLAADNADLSEVARRFRESVVLIGNPKLGHGTGWVLSKENRLIVTNAHVADLYSLDQSDTFVIPNTTSNRYAIQKVWYHPGLIRKGQGLLIREQFPRMAGLHGDFPVDPVSPDLAILELAEGAELSEEFPMATPEEVTDMFSLPVAMIGFPGHDTTKVPEPGEKVEGTFRAGNISRLSDFEFNSNAAEASKQFVQHSLASFGGFSGSPLFLKNGHVVVINNSGLVATDREEKLNLSYGIRIDALWELIAYHKLENKVPIPVSASSLHLARFDEPWAPSENGKKAVKLVEDCDRYSWGTEEGLLAAIKDLNKAIELAPNYPEAYARRASLYINLSRILEPEEMKYLQLGLADAKTRVDLVPSDLDAIVEYLDYLHTISLKMNEKFHPQIAEAVTKVLESDLLKNSYEARVEGWRRRGRVWTLPASRLNRLLPSR